jgi:hypothetical protein
VIVTVTGIAITVIEEMIEGMTDEMIEGMTDERIGEMIEADEIEMSRIPSDPTETEVIIVIVIVIMIVEMIVEMTVIMTDAILVTGIEETTVIVITAAMIATGEIVIVTVTVTMIVHELATTNPTLNVSMMMVIGDEIHKMPSRQHTSFLVSPPLDCLCVCTM